jgi:hypothetical protein
MEPNQLIMPDDRLITPDRLTEADRLIDYFADADALEKGDHDGTIDKLMALRGLIASNRVSLDAIDSDRLSRISRGVQCAEFIFEMKYSRDISQDRRDFRQIPCIDSYNRQISEEIALFRSTGGRVSGITFVGCGSLPISAIRWSEELDARVVAIDYCQQAVDGARLVVEQVSASATSSASVAVEMGDGKGYRYPEGSLVIIANMVDDLNGVLEQVATSGAAMVVLRTTFGARQLYYPHHEVSNRAFLDRYALVGRTDPERGHFISTSYLFQRSTGV